MTERGEDSALTELVQSVHALRQELDSLGVTLNDAWFTFDARLDRHNQAISALERQALKSDDLTDITYRLEKLERALDILSRRLPYYS